MRSPRYGGTRRHCHDQGPENHSRQGRPARAGQTTRSRRPWWRWRSTSLGPEYELYLAVENIDHTRTKAKSPQTNGIVERFHKTMLDEFYRIAFRKKLYGTIEDLQADLDLWMREFNQGPIRASGVSERPPCRPSLTRSRWRAKNPSRSPRQTNPTPHEKGEAPGPQIVADTKEGNHDRTRPRAVSLPKVATVCFWRHRQGRELHLRRPVAVVTRPGSGRRTISHARARELHCMLCRDGQGQCPASACASQ